MNNESSPLTPLQEIEGIQAALMPLGYRIDGFERLGNCNYYFGFTIHVSSSLKTESEKSRASV